MTKTQIVTIDGQQYDAVTGLKVGSDAHQEPKTVSAPAVAPTHTPATHLHASLQRSTTLRRKTTKKPVHKHPLVRSHQPTARMTDVAKHPDIRKFAPHPVDAIKPKPKIMDIGPVTHPLVAK